MGLDVKTLRRSFHFKMPGIEKGTAPLKNLSGSQFLSLPRGVVNASPI